MKTLISTLTCALLLALPMTGFAATDAKAVRAKCVADAGDLTGAAKKASVRDCVKANRALTETRAPTEKQLAQRAKMKRCSADFKASGREKSERKAFLGACLKG